MSGLEFPAWIASGTAGVAVSMLGGRSVPMSLALGIATDRLHQRLRVDDGLAYSVDGGRLPLGADRTHVSVGADCQDRNAPAVATAVLEVLAEFAADGPTEAEFEDLHRRAERVPRDDADALKSALDFAATEELLGGEPHDADELRRQRLAATPEEARAAFADAFASRLVIVPDSCPRPAEDLKELERPVTRFDGRVHEDRQAPQGDLLIVDDAGVYWFDGKKNEVSIPAAEVAFVTRRTAGVLCVYGIDSSWIEIDPRRITDGAEAAETVARLAGGAERFVPSEPEGAAAVEELAKQSLDRVWEVGNELDVLPDALQPGEVPRSMARGAAARSPGCSSSPTGG